MPQQAVLVAFLHRNIRGHRKGFFWVSSNTVLKCSKSRDHLVSFQNFCALAYRFPSKTMMHLHTTHPQTVAALLYLPQHPMKYSMQSVHMQIKTLYSIYSYFGNPLVPAGLTSSIATLAIPWFQQGLPSLATLLVWLERIYQFSKF